MNSSSTPTQRLVRHALTLAMSVCFIAAGWLLLKPLVRPARAEASATSTTPWTTKAIEDIQVGDLVLARDEQGTALGWKPVKEVYRRTSYHLRHLTFRDAAGREQTFETTDEHPFWSVTAKAFVNAGDLITGDRVVSIPQHTSSGQTPLAVDPALVQTLTATHRDAHPTGITVYNFQVEDFHTYFVAARGATGPPVLVHNANYGRAPEFESGALTEGEFLDNALEYLKPGYSEVSPGRYLSGDGLRQVRYGAHETQGLRHHGHFEVYDIAGGGVIENAVVDILP